MTRCDTCPGKYRIIPGDGPEPCHYLGLGERPGQSENQQGRPFVGASGQELNDNYLALAGLSRSEVYLTNTAKCFAEQNRKPTAKEAQSCAAHHLPTELGQVQPEIVFLLGATACGLIPDIDLDTEHGIPRHGKLFEWEGWVVPMYHPAAGLHDTAMMIPMLEDWEKLETWLSGDIGSGFGGVEVGWSTYWPWPQDPFTHEDYRLARTKHEVSRYFSDYWTRAGRLMSVDTESHSGSHYSTQVSICPGTAVMAYRDNPSAQFGLLHFIRTWEEVVFHNAPADLPYVEPVRSYRDTLIEAYHFGNLPQGLKALGYRICGVKMKSWMDVVSGPSRQKLMEWMAAAWAYEAEHPEITVKQLKTRIKEIKKPNAVGALLARTIQHTMDSSEYDPWERLGKIPKDRLDRLIEVCGPIPELGIAHVPEDQLIEYACRDADIGLRVALDFEQRRRDQERQWNVSTEDCDQTGLGLGPGTQTQPKDTRLHPSPAP